MPAFRWLLLGVVFLICAGAPARSSGFEDIQIRLGVPPIEASVTDAWLPSPDALPEFIVIQDAHRNLEVQDRIASLILHGYRAWDAHKVFVEGAFETVDLHLFHVLNDRERRGLSEHLVQQGTLSGPEQAGIQIFEKEWRKPPVSPFDVVGMEDPHLYAASMEAYKEVLRTRPQAAAQIQEFNRLHDSLHLPPDHQLRSHLRLITKMIELRLTPREYELYKANRKAIPMSPNLAPALKAAERFYALADKRSLVFVQEARRKLPAAEGPRVIVVGGFHAPLLGQTLREQGKSYVVLTPTAVEPATDALYERRLLEASCFF